MRTIIFTAKKTTTLSLVAAALSGLFLPAAHAATSAEPMPVTQKAVKPLQLAPNAPERHVVVPGDTLWGIASKFLKDPYRWNELYQANKNDIKNPNLIYPGQVLVLDRSGASPRLVSDSVKLEPREYVEQIKKPIWTVSPEAIAAFLTKPLVMEPGMIEQAARIVGLQENHVIAGTGDRIYVTNVGKPQKDWHVFKLGDVLKDPDTGDVLGQEILNIAEARQLTEGEQPTFRGLFDQRQSTDGQPAEFVLKSAVQEVAAGNYLLPAPPARVIDYTPKAPLKDIRGRIITLAGGVGYAGANSVVGINRGQQDGIEPGHVLATYNAGELIKDREDLGAVTYQLPDKRNGLVFIFRVFEHVSYGLIMEARRPVERGDTVRTP